MSSSSRTPAYSKPFCPAGFGDPVRFTGASLDTHFSLSLDSDIGSSKLIDLIQNQ
jgi:hypothetical protein